MEKLSFANMESFEVYDACVAELEADNSALIAQAAAWMEIGDMKELASRAAITPNARESFKTIVSLLAPSHQKYGSVTTVSPLLCLSARQNCIHQVADHLDLVPVSHPAYSKILVTAVRACALDTVQLILEKPFTPGYLCSTALVAAIQSENTVMVEMIYKRTPFEDIPHVVRSCVEEINQTSTEDNRYEYLDLFVSRLPMEQFVDTYKLIHNTVKSMKLEHIQARHAKNQMSRAVAAEHSATECVSDVAEARPLRKM